MLSLSPKLLELHYLYWLAQAKLQASATRGQIRFATYKREGFGMLPRTGETHGEMLWPLCLLCAWVPLWLPTKSGNYSLYGSAVTRALMQEMLPEKAHKP